MNKMLKADQTPNIFKFKPVQTVAFGAIFMALRVVLGMFEINIGDSYRFTFSPLPVTLAAYMLGPVWGGIIGGCGDIITLFIHPSGGGGINPGILLAKVLWGVIMGLLLHKKSVTWLRAIAANFIAIIVCNVCITTASLCIVYGYPVEAILPVRLITDSVHFVVYSVATYFFAILLVNIYNKTQSKFAH